MKKIITRLLYDLIEDKYRKKIESIRFLIDSL